MPTKPPVPDTYKKNNVTGGRGSMPGGRNNQALIIKDAERVAKAYLAAHPVTPKAPAKTKAAPVTLPDFEKWANKALEGLSKTAIAQGFALLDKKGFIPKKKR